MWKEWYLWRIEVTSWFDAGGQTKIMIMMKAMGDREKGESKNRKPVMVIQTKRVYEAPYRQDGVRVLVDRVWPRGLSKDRAQIDIWAKEVAPSTELRKWFSHDPDKWEEFKKRYFRELAHNKESLQTLIDQTDKKKLTLVYGAKQEEYNNANALKEYIESSVLGKRSCI
jgi:uncharacterized protein YeaO (DUF488 family)